MWCQWVNNLVFHCHHLLEDKQQLGGAICWLCLSALGTIDVKVMETLPAQSNLHTPQLTLWTVVQNKVTIVHGPGIETHLTTAFIFNMLFPCDSSLFTKKTSVTGKRLALWLLTNLLFSLFWGAYITPFWWVLLFQNAAVISTGISTLDTQVNSCYTHTKHTQKQAQLIIVVATTKYYT